MFWYWVGHAIATIFIGFFRLIFNIIKWIVCGIISLFTKNNSDDGTEDSGNY